MIKKFTNISNSPNKKRALILGGGGILGAYSAGVTSTLCKNLGAQYFDTIYAVSVGVYAATFYAANQPQTIENTWRNYVSKNKLVNFLNPFKKREIMDLEYLNKIFQNQKSLLNLEDLFQTPTKLIYVLTNKKSMQPSYVSPTKENIFILMKASCAQPILHSPIKWKGEEYIDGGLSDPLPLKKALDDGHDEIVIISNRSKKFNPQNQYIKKLYPLIKMPFISKIKFAKLISNLKEKKYRLEHELEKMIMQNQKIEIIRPKSKLKLKNIIDTNHQRINQTIDMGIKDAQEFLKSQSEKKKSV